MGTHMGTHMGNPAVQDGIAFAKENGMLFIECSAKTKAGIAQAIEVRTRVLTYGGTQRRTRRVICGHRMAALTLARHRGT